MTKRRQTGGRIANTNTSPPLRVQVRRTRKQLYEHIDGDYYGYRDEEDGILVTVEAAAEAVMRKEVLGCCQPEPNFITVLLARVSGLEMQVKRM